MYETDYLIKLVGFQYTKDTTVILYKNTTISSVGTEIDVYNYDTTSETSFRSKVYHTPTITSNGSQAIPLLTYYASDTLPNRTQINSGDTAFSRVLNHDTIYLLKITNVSDDSAKIAFTFTLNERFL